MSDEKRIEDMPWPANALAILKEEHDARMTSGTIRVWASVGDSLPRLLVEMTQEEWRAGKEIPRLSPLAWGQAAEVCVHTIVGPNSGFFEPKDGEP